MVFLKNKIIVFFFIVFLLLPDTTFACGMCVDHNLDWIAPFILPMFPVALAYLLTRRILHVFRILPDTVSKPKLMHLIVFMAVVFFLSYIGMGSLGLVMLVFIAAALQNYIRSCKAIWKMTKVSPEVRIPKTFQLIFLILWLASGVATLFWSSSSVRMMIHLSYSGSTFEQAKSYYATNVFQHKEQIKAVLNSACDKPHEINPLGLSSIFFLSSKLNDSSLARSIARLLVSNINKDDIFFEEGLSALKSLDKTILIKTCITLLDSKKLSGKNVENIGSKYGERLSLILSHLINNCQQKEYIRFITKDNLNIMQKYRYERDIKVQGSRTTGSKKNIGLEGLNLDLESFNVDSAPKEAVSAEDKKKAAEWVKKAQNLWKDGKLTNHHEALHYLDLAISLNPNNAKTYNDHGVIYHEIAKYQKAIDDYNQAIRLDSNYANAYFNMGLSNLELNDLDSMCKNFKKACELGECDGLNWAKQEGICQ